MIATEVSIEVNIVHCGLLWELISLSSLLRVHAFAVGSIILHAFHGLIKLILEHLNGLERFSQYKLCKSGVELSQLIHVDIESVASAENSSNLFLTLLMIQIILNHFLHLQLFCIRVH